MRAKRLTEEQKIKRIAAGKVVATEINDYFNENSDEPIPNLTIDSSLDRKYLKVTAVYICPSDPEPKYLTKSLVPGTKLVFTGSVRSSTARGDVILIFKKTDAVGNWLTTNRTGRYNLNHIEIGWAQVKEMNAGFAEWLTDTLGDDIDNMIDNAGVAQEEIMEAKKKEEERKVKVLEEILPTWGLFS